MLYLKRFGKIALLSFITLMVMIGAMEGFVFREIYPSMLDGVMTTLITYKSLMLMLFLCFFAIGNIFNYVMLNYNKAPN
jgi:hypothetical protein